MDGSLRCLKGPYPIGGIEEGRANRYGSNARSNALLSGSPLISQWVSFFEAPFSQMTIDALVSTSSLRFPSQSVPPTRLQSACVLHR